MMTAMSLRDAAVLLCVLFAAWAPRASAAPLPSPTPGEGVLAAVQVRYGTFGPWPRWSFGPTVGGGTLVGMRAEVQTSPSVWLRTGLGLRVGMSIQELYPNAALSLGVGSAFGEGKFRNGVFGEVGASAPIGFFDAWVAAGWSAHLYRKSGQRSVNLEVGPAVYLVRELPPETSLHWPVFLLARAAFPFEFGRQ